MEIVTCRDYYIYMYQCQCTDQAFPSIRITGICMVITLAWLTASTQEDVTNPPIPWSTGLQKHHGNLITFTVYIFFFAIY